MRMRCGVVATAIFLAVMPGGLAAQQFLPSDSLSLTPRKPVQLLWLSAGFGALGDPPPLFQLRSRYFSDLAYQAQLTLERENLVYSLRYADIEHDFGFSSLALAPESTKELDALIGLGAYSRYVLVNGSIGIGFRHYNYYLTDPNLDRWSMPAAAASNSVAIPAQFNLMIPYFDEMAFGVSLFATYSRDEFDHGFALTYSWGKITEAVLPAGRIAH